MREFNIFFYDWENRFCEKENKFQNVMKFVNKEKKKVIVALIIVFLPYIIFPFFNSFTAIIYWIFQFFIIFLCVHIQAKKWNVEIHSDLDLKFKEEKEKQKLITDFLDSEPYNYYSINKIDWLIDCCYKSIEIHQISTSFKMPKWLSTIGYVSFTTLFSIIITDFIFVDLTSQEKLAIILVICLFILLFVYIAYNVSLQYYQYNSMKTYKYNKLVYVLNDLRKNISNDNRSN